MTQLIALSEPYSGRINRLIFNLPTFQVKINKTDMAASFKSDNTTKISNIKTETTEAVSVQDLQAFMLILNRYLNAVDLAMTKYNRMVDKYIPPHDFSMEEIENIFNIEKDGRVQ
ncbi:hypothetical protein KAU11_07745 [Candidatus Babeliales bacterium]|nr:hypothetical protein [Candidatus Babeliales bacterium]